MTLTKEKNNTHKQRKLAMMMSVQSKNQTGMKRSSTDINGRQKVAFVSQADAYGTRIAGNLNFPLAQRSLLKRKSDLV